MYYTGIRTLWEDSRVLCAELPNKEAPTGSLEPSAQESLQYGSRNNNQYHFEVYVLQVSDTIALLRIRDHTIGNIQAPTVPSLNSARLSVR